MVGEKIMACNRRLGGSAKDVYDLYLWAGRPFDEALVRRLAVLKAWTDRRAGRPYRPNEFLDQIEPRRFRWEDIGGLVPRRLESDPERICATVRGTLRRRWRRVSVQTAWLYAWTGRPDSSCRESPMRLRSFGRQTSR